MKTPFPGATLLRRSSIARRSVREAIPGSSDSFPKLNPATPAKFTEGLTSALEARGMPLPNSSTIRAHTPSLAVSDTTGHPSAFAILPNSVNNTVLPKPRWPVTSMRRPGAPAPSRSPWKKSAMSASLPMRIGGIFPAVGRKGFTFLAFYGTTDVRIIPNRTKSHNNALFALFLCSDITRRDPRQAVLRRRLTQELAYVNLQQVR